MAQKPSGPFHVHQQSHPSHPFTHARTTCHVKFKTRHGVHLNLTEAGQVISGLDKYMPSIYGKGFV
ncbi:hypothetical protein BABINDRAFT_114123 [Babjeviella inositovora NRRL Y-12698]|uniref:Uncharacterized protein n=1 Tax=Babjeviella inositovora NRRL Y-12698 TaxID=984486 RepID=A0A1E3QWH2_9ASCO|nr:uncharacterized protein BABINDRAFT_114123 [Babjeviella inositovora NRRL Y-12698]ODQ81990.1 hypothetical protein BABINDRAFT_114123 [Babjeviella inositovora NRRL Y-12698]